jgi:DnaJ-like protein
MTTKVAADPYTILGVDPGATADEIHAAYKRLAQIYHPDRYANVSEDVRRESERRMKEVNSAYQATKEHASAPPSADHSDEEREAREAIRKAHEYKGSYCLLCGHGPAASVTLKSGSGKVIWRTIRTWRGDLCRNCGMAMFREAQNETLIKGWWGIISFFANIAYVISNIAQRQRIRNLQRPQATPMVAVTPLSQPAPETAPLSRRAGPYVAVVALLIAAAMAAGALAPESGGSSPTSSAPSLSLPPVVKDCGYTSGSYIIKVSCSDSSATLRIAARYPSGTSEYRCPSFVSYWTTDKNSGELLCWSTI